MKIIEFIPLKGIPHITFGMQRSLVREIIQKEYTEEKPALRRPETDCYFENSLQFSYEEDDTLSFIEAGPPLTVVKIFGINTWEVSGEELLNYLSGIDSINHEISEGGANPIFKNNIITLWDLDEQYDHVGGYITRKWGAIGIGDERYYNAICDIYK